MVRKRASHTPSPSRFDREWQYQVALPDDLCVMENFSLIRAFCAEHGFDPKVRTVTAVWLPERIKQEQFRLLCFADKQAALAFQAQFGGYFFDPKRDREGGRGRGVWLRQGAHERILGSGPLHVPACLWN